MSRALKPSVLVDEIILRFGTLERVCGEYGVSTLRDVLRLAAVIAEQDEACDRMSDDRLVPGENSRIIELLYSLDRGRRYLELVDEQEIVAFYVVFIFGDVDPMVYGPFATAEERDQKARELRGTHGRDEGGIYWLDKHTNGAVEFRAYTGDIFADIDKE